MAPLLSKNMYCEFAVPVLAYDPVLAAVALPELLTKIVQQLSETVVRLTVAGVAVDWPWVLASMVVLCCAPE